MPPPQLALAHATAGRAVLRWLRAELRGRDRVPGAGGVILAPNHLSLIDIPLMGAASPRPCWYLGKAELEGGVVGGALEAFGMVPISRGRGDAATLARLTRMVAGGEVVTVFPEGSRSPDGRLHRLRSGVARLAAAARAPVVPVGLVGTEQWWPRQGRPERLRPAPGTITVAFGVPLAPPDDAPAPRRRFTAALTEALAACSGQERAPGYAPIAS